MNAKYYKTIVLLREISVMYRRFTLPVKLVKSRFWLSPSYYPELPQKSRMRIFMELLLHIFRYGSIEWNYFSYGLDIINWRNANAYIDDSWFLWKSSMLNTVQVDYDYTVLLRDKILFSNYVSNLGYKTPRIVMQLPLIQEISTNAQIDRLLANAGGGLIFKPFGGQCGKGIFKVYNKDEKWYVGDICVARSKLVKTINQILPKVPYIVQELVVQHSVLNQIYDKSVNTLRLVTVSVSRNSRVVPLSAVLRVGAYGNSVDNWAQGGLAIGVDLNTGRLKQYGFYKHGLGTKTEYHPDSGVKFSNIMLPFFKLAVDQACSLHSFFGEIRIIGWDIAFSPDGPVFIEGNDNMEISINQEANDGLKYELLQLIK